MEWMADFHTLTFVMTDPFLHLNKLNITAATIKVLY